MEIRPSLSLSIPLLLPARILQVAGFPRIIAGGVPVTPINLIFQQRQRDQGSTPASLATYARAARLYVEFCALRSCSLLDVTNEEFIWFKNALLGEPFWDADGKSVHLSSKLNRRTADLMLTLLYSLAGDIAERYGVRFPWRTYNSTTEQTDGSSHSTRYSSRSRAGGSIRRKHRIKWIRPKVKGLPDPQFVKLLKAAYQHWGNQVVDGDLAFATDPEAQRGALFFRNVAILLILRCAGSRRSEVVQVRFKDLDRAQHTLYLRTKGHGEERLPVLLLPEVEHVIWLYITCFRPEMSQDLDDNSSEVFLSHSVRNYGKPLSNQCAPNIIKTLRPVLDSPWSISLRPHMLRHSYGYDVQKLAGEAAVTASMRHASIQSSEPYRAGIENFMDELLGPADQKLRNLLRRAGLLEILHP